ncbi:MAG: hypothetical protein KAG20_02830 [Cocleimonas sp.]|nr:hypothetical protein [Cocleimonas sp.]
MKKHMLKNDCEAYFLTAEESNREIANNLDNMMCNLGEVRAKQFLSIAYSTLKESVDILYSSLETNDTVLCAQVSHKIRGSSNLYASKVLTSILFEFTTNPEQSLNSLEKCKRLVCEFELVLRILKKCS